MPHPGAEPILPNVMPSPSLPLGANLPGTPYRVVRLLGAGGMGEVYEAEHELLGARRALKVLSPHSEGRRGVAERIKTEARALAKLQHPNLVEVVDLGISEGRWYFAMTLLEGRTLRDVATARGTMAWDEAARIVVAMLDGLHAAHGLGLVHRDVKPENTFVCDDGMIKVLDFGIAKISSLDAITQSGHTIGTPKYMAPEQIEGRAVDGRTDVYSAGLVLYELIAGEPPFADDDPMALAYAHVNRAPPVLANEGGDTPERLARAIARALEKSIQARFESAATFASELRACLRDAGLATTDAPIPRRLPGKELSDLRAETPEHALPSAPTTTMTSESIALPARTNDAVAVRQRGGSRTGIVAIGGVAIALLVLGIVATRSGGVAPPREAIAASDAIAASAANAPSAEAALPDATIALRAYEAAPATPIALDRAEPLGKKTRPQASGGTRDRKPAAHDAGARREDDSLILE